ncbi:putative alpha-glycosyltransferase/ family 4 [Synechococcus sp. A15-127]|uniref:glycosyltransferase n=1 Tax=Synechococcus sp. A15-127 TaxID=1050624 RepID=UPI0016440BCC|nr:glycosyltransferase [Synechococcus sp. A15-127]QNI95400.1 putative alpha-glycosyltransferase/ family 4 [Synechococcus sp. A15-127]
MDQYWVTKVQWLVELDRQQAFAQLADALNRLPQSCPQEHSAAIAHWRGKVALIAGRTAEAVPQLALAASLASERAAYQYLLGAALVRQQQWLDACSALKRALALQPGLQPALLELATVLIAIGEPEHAIKVLQPLHTSINPVVIAKRALGQVRVAEPADEAAQIAALALEDSPRLPESLLREWLQITGGLLLAKKFSEARCWLQALATVTPDPAALANPIPRRIAWIALAALELIEPSPQPINPCLPELQNLLWQQASLTERSLWSSWLEPFLEQLASHLERQPHPDQHRCRQLLTAILSALPSLLPAQQRQTSLMKKLKQCRDSDSPRPSVVCDAGSDRTARARLQEASDALLNHLPLLVVHPAAELLSEAMQRRCQGLDQLWCDVQLLIAIRDPLPWHQRPRRRWLLLASDDLPQCFLYRVDQKRQQLEALGCEVRVVLQDALADQSWSEALLWADALIVCRLPATASVLGAMAAASHAGIPSWYDLDDLVVDPDHGIPPLASYGGTITPLQHRLLQLDVPLFAAAMRACDGAIVSTGSLADRWRQLNPGQPVLQLANLIPPDLQAAQRLPRRSPRSPRLVVASGTSAHKQIWIEVLAPALAKLLCRHPQLQLDLLGELQLPLVLLPFAERIRCHPFSDYATYVQRLGVADIGLAALEPGLHTDAKSAIRWMEFSLCGLASVLSPTATFTELLEDGVHARFARGTEQWLEAVEQLLADPAARRALAKRAQQHAQELFGPHQSEAFWRPLIEPAEAAQPAQHRKKLLVLNVFFAPQSIGGATRVAQDQVQALSEHLGDQWEITVLCTEDEPWQLPAPPHDPEAWLKPGLIPLQIHSWNGVRVVRLALPERPWSEHHDPRVEQLCRWWFAQEEFDLIHAHAIQVLGGGPLRVAAELGIPYAVTLHDGWWLSPRQFLLTPLGRPVDLSDPIGHHDVPDRISPEQLERERQRRQELEQLLQGAAARIAVSDSFAELHRQAGIEAVTVMENRWQPMPPVSPRQRRPADQPLRCCYVGGLCLHKGYHVLQSALLQAQPAAPGLELTVLDGSLENDQGYCLQWGSTPVEVRPGLPMPAMADFYSQHDVLIAPSIWPESYGLVSREALSAGLWVVASDAGAMAEPIRHGQNGHRVAAGNAQALAAVLEQLAADHPTPQPLIAFSGERPPLHQELDQLYRSLLKA